MCRGCYVSTGENRRTRQRQLDDLTGKTFGKLTVLRLSHYSARSTGRRERVWLLQCLCGELTKVRTGQLNSGNTQSCGCGKIPPRKGSLAADGKKRCSKCRTVRPLQHFAKNKKYKDGWHGVCKICTNLNRVRRRYGLDAEQYMALVGLLDGMCHACKTRPGKHIDHCHTSGHIRGFLCIHCNIALGNAYDSPQVLSQLIEYLKTTSGSRLGLFDSRI